jgi:RNA polymerase sigma-70 factor (ECF subfamily)
LGHLSSLMDEALLQAALSGSEEAWTELVDRYNVKGLRFVRRQIDEPSIAHDIMQDLWVALVRTVNRQMPDSFGAVFWTVLRRRVIDELRRRGRSRESATLDAPTSVLESEGDSLLDRTSGEIADPLEESLRSEDEQLLYAALKNLPDHYRIVVVARQLEGRSNRETAALLVAEGLLTDDGNVEKRVENYYYRGLKELRKQLEALGFSGGGSAA